MQMYIIPVDTRADVAFGAAALTADRRDNMNWKYKIDVENQNVFSDIEKKYGVIISDELRALILMANAATPSKYNFMLGTAEKVLGAILSFNEGETDTDTVYAALSTMEDKSLVPFAIDPFGNYICYSNKDNKVVFWDHETNVVSSTEKGLSEFLNSLY